MSMRVRVVAAMVALGLASAPGAQGQISYGNLYGNVADASGGVLPGATVTLSGPFTRSTVSGSDGRFRILRVEPGEYDLTVEMVGFAPMRRPVVITTGEDVHLDFQLEVASVQELMTVIAETPIIDPGRVGTQTTVKKDEAVRVPNSRDPWALLRTVPGVVVDRVNVAGNESGNQSFFQAKGADRSDTNWNLDGVSFDDMALGGTPMSYFDFDFFDELAVSTGGNPVEVQTGAISLNFVTRRGTNQWHAALKSYLTHDSLQWSNLGGTELQGDPRLELDDGSFSDQADHIQQISDLGGDFGGPLLRDRLFVYASYGRQDIRLVHLDQTREKTVLESFVGKLNWQVSQNTQASLFWFNGKKTALGRRFGTLQAAESALLDQTSQYEGFLPFDLHGMLKLEVNHAFTPSLLLNLTYTNYDSGFGLYSRDTGPGTADYVSGELLGSGWGQLGPITRPIKNMTNLTLDYFVSGLGGQHELKFGFGYKRTPVSTLTVIGGADTGLFGSIFGPGESYVEVTREGLLRYEGEYLHAFVGDTFTRGRATVNAGLRFDHQVARNLPAPVAASPSFPDRLPAIDYTGGGTGAAWSDVSPRIGISVALEESRRTVARASLARYAGKLSTFQIAFDNPVGVSSIAYRWSDRNGDRLPQPSEVDLDSGIQWFNRVDLSDPAAVESPNAIDPDYRAPDDYEVLVGIDRELLPDLAVGAAYTWRRTSAQRDWQPRLGMSSADFTVSSTVTANGFSGQVYSPDPALVAAGNGGRLLTNRPDYHRSYDGLELSLVKRLSHRWMARAALSWMDSREHLDGPGAVHNPTPTDASGGRWSGPQVDGGVASEVGKGRVYYTASWQLVLHGLVELPEGFEVGAALFGRQGFPQPVYLALTAGLDGPANVLAVDTLDDARYPSLWNLDLRIGKSVGLGGEAQLALEACAFNVLNASTDLNRFMQANSDAFRRLDAILSPRIVRLGARVTF
jgi:hypothetical protein